MFGMVNMMSVVAATVVSFVFGFVYFHPNVMGTRWMKSAGLKQKDMEKANMGKSISIGLLGTFVGAYVLAGVLSLTNAMSLDAALNVAFWLWLGFYAANSLGAVAWEGKGWDFWTVVNVWGLLNMLLMAAVIVSV